MKRSPRTRLIGGAALLIVLLLALAIPFVASAPSQDAFAQGKHHRQHPAPPPHHRPTPSPTAQPPTTSIVASPNPVIISSDGFARAYFVLVGNRLTPNHTYSLSTNAACSLQALVPNPAIADLDSHIQVNGQFYHCAPGTYYIVAVDSQGGSTYSTSITLLPPMVSASSMAKNAQSKR